MERDCMARPLNGDERKWFRRLFEADFQDKEILKRQIDAASVEGVLRLDGLIAVELSIPEDAPRYPHSIRVPASMDDLREEGAPIMFLLHVVNGFAKELEVASADSTAFDERDISLREVKYHVSPEVAPL